MIVPLSANPDFDDKIEDVTLWFIEYDDVVNHIANREIGFAKDGRIIVKMPDDRNYGYWLDTNCELEDFKKMGINMITEKEFNDLWNSVYYDREAKEFKQTVIKMETKECMQSCLHGHFWAASFTLWMRRARKSSMLHTMRGGKQTETLNTIGPALWLHGA